jgi:hypothetical protein
MRTTAHVLDVITLLAFWAFSSSIWAGEPTKASLSFDDLVRPPTAEIAAEPCQPYIGEARTACEQNVKAEFDHQRWRMEYTQKAFEAHHVYTLFVFILVCALVVLGMWLSFEEFRRASRRPAAPTRRGPDASRAPGGSGKEDAKSGDSATDAQVNAATKSTLLELGSSGVKLTSPVLGVIVLVVSMGFFYLYLKTVYPIEEAQPASVSRSSTMDSKKPAQAKE